MTESALLPVFSGLPCNCGQSAAEMPAASASITAATQDNINEIFMLLWLPLFVIMLMPK
jgi:hypothetical protein